MMDKQGHKGQGQHQERVGTWRQEVQENQGDEADIRFLAHKPNIFNRKAQSPRGDNQSRNDFLCFRGWI